MQTATLATGSAPATVPTAALRSGGALSITGQGIKLIVQLGSLALMARLLSPADFGLYSLVAPIAAFFLLFNDLGLTSATIYADNVTDREVTSLFWLSTASGVVLGICLVGLAPLASAFYDEPRLTAVLSTMALIFVCNGIGAQYRALLQRELRFKALVTIEVGSVVLSTALGLLAALYGLGYWSLIIAAIALQAIDLIGCAVTSRWQPGRPTWEVRTAMMARFGSSVAGFNILNYFARNLDNLLIGKVWGLSALGLYGRAYTLLMAPLSQVIYPLNKVVVPVLTRINHDRSTYVRTYERILGVILLVCTPLVTWLLVAREAIVHVFLGPQWHEVAPIFLSLGFAALVQPLNNSAGWLLLSQGRARDIFSSGVLSCAIAVTSFAIGLPWGARGVATAYAIGQICAATPALWWLTCRGGRFPLAPVLATAVPVWIAAAVAGCSFHLVQTAFPMQGRLQQLACAALWVSAAFVATLTAMPSGRRLLRACLPTQVLAAFRSASRTVQRPAPRSEE